MFPLASASVYFMCGSIIGKALLCLAIIRDFYMYEMCAPIYECELHIYVYIYLCAYIYECILYTCIYAIYVSDICYLTHLSKAFVILK